MTAQPVSQLAKDIAALCAHGPNFGLTIQESQTQHRLDLISKWPFGAGSKILELGCGQGDCTAALAEMVGETGHVDAVDPAPLDYGSPFTLGQAHDHLSAGRLGNRITWIQAKPIDFLQSQSEKNAPKYDVAVLAHCIWYFSSPEIILETLRALSTRARHICIAEWSLSSSVASRGSAHVLAVLAEAMLESHKPESSSNVRTVSSPVRIKALAEKAGLSLQSESVWSPTEGMHDGRWEVEAVLNPSFLTEVDTFVDNEREKAAILATYDAVKTATEEVGGVKAVQAMDVWCAVFAPL